MKEVDVTLLSIMIIVSSLAGCIGEEEYDTSEYESQIAELELQLIGANNTSADLILQLESANASIEAMQSQNTELMLQLESANASIEAMQSQITELMLQLECPSDEISDCEKYGIHEISTFFTWNRCSPLLDSTLLEGQSFYDVFDDSNLDLSVCDSQYQHYEIDSSTSLSLPLKFTIDVYLDTDLLRPKQLPSSWEHDNEWLYNCDEDCYKHAIIADADGQAVEMEGGYYGYNNDVFQYLYDDTTGSGYYIDTIRFFVCNSGEYVNSEEYNDGNLDCEDGSDEDNEDVEMSDLWCNLGQGNEEQVPFDWLNDGIGDCYDGSDEPEGNPSSDDEDEQSPDDEDESSENEDDVRLER